MLCIVILVTSCSPPGAPSQAEVVNDMLWGGLPSGSSNPSKVIQMYTVDTLTIVTFVRYYRGYQYPELGCLIGQTDAFGKLRQVSTMSTFSSRTTQLLAAQPLVVLQDYFAGHHVTCIFTQEQLVATTDVALRVTTKTGEQVTYPFDQQTVIVVDTQTPANQMPFRTYELIDEHGGVLYTTRKPDHGFP